MTMTQKITDAAATAHEVNRAYCQGLGDSSQRSWVDSPRWQKDSSIAGAKAIAEDPNLTPAQIHKSWCDQKYSEGWDFGEKKDAVKKLHPCLMAYEYLPAEQRAKDVLFVTTVRGILGI